MGSELFGIDISGIIADTIGPGLLEVTITRQPTGAPLAGSLTAGRAAVGSPSVWTCQGYWEDFTNTPPPSIELELGDRKAVLIGDTIPAEALPLKGNDAITIEGQTLFMVTVLSRDPAAAVYVLLCRDRGSAEA